MGLIIEAILCNLQSQCPSLNVIAGIYMYMDAHARNGGFLTRGSCLLVRKGLIQSNVSFASNSH